MRVSPSPSLHAPGGADAGPPPPGGDAAPTPSSSTARRPLASSARALLARAGRTLRPNGVTFAALGNIVNGSRTLRGGTALSTMTAGAARPAEAGHAAHQPELLAGGVNHAGRHARDAARLAVGELLDGGATAAWPLPKFGAAAADAEAGEALIGMLSSQPRLEDEARRLFPHAGAAGASRQALTQLLALLQRAAGPAAAPAATAGPQEGPAMLLLALAAATGGAPAPALDAARVLARGLDIAAAPAAGTADTAAWRAAELLAGAGGAGFDALLALSPPPGTPAQQERRRQSLRIFLEARPCLAGPAPRAEPARLATAAAVKLWRHTALDRANLTPAEKSAHFNWRNGMRDAGPGGELAQAQARLQKSLTWLRRAQRRGRRAYNWTLNPARYVGLHKTPVAAMQDGTLGAHLDTDAKENQRHDAPFARAVTALKAALQARLPACEDHTAAARMALAVVQLEHWERQIAAGGAPGACRFDAADAAGLLSQAQRRLQAQAGKQFAALWLGSQASRHRRAIAGQACTLDTLRRWAASHGAGADPAYAAEIGAADAALAGRVMKPADLSIRAICDYLARYATMVPMGNRLRHFDGAVVGINNTSLPGLPASPDLRARRSGLAVVEVNTGGHAHEIAFGKQVLWQGHLGAQHTSGLKALDWFHAGSTNGGNSGGEAGMFVGLRLRFLRRLDANQVGTDAHRAMSADFIRRLGDAAEAPRHRGGGAARLWDALLVDPYFDAPFSVSWQRHPQQSSKIQAYSITGVSAALGGGHISGDAAQGRDGGGAVLGASASVGYEINPSIGLNRSERSGATPRTVVQMGWGARGTARAGAGVAPPGGASLNLASAGATFAGHSVMAAARAFERDGRLASDFVYQDIESETLEGYVGGLRKNWPLWTAAVGEANLTAQLAATRRGFRPNQRPAERWRIRADAARRFDALRGALHLRRAAADAEADPAARAAIEAECAGIGAAALRLFTDFGRWWEPVGTWNLELNGAVNSVMGSNWWLQLMPERSVLADRELSWLGSSTAQMNRHSKAFGPPPA